MSGKLELHPFSWAGTRREKCLGVLVLAGYDIFLSWRRCPPLLLPSPPCSGDWPQRQRCRCYPSLWPALDFPLSCGFSRNVENGCPYPCGPMRILGVFLALPVVQEGLLQAICSLKKWLFSRPSRSSHCSPVRVQSATVLLLLGFTRACSASATSRGSMLTGKTKLACDDDIYIVTGESFLLVLSWMGGISCYRSAGLHTCSSRIHGQYNSWRSCSATDLGVQHTRHCQVRG